MIMIMKLMMIMARLRPTRAARIRAVRIPAVSSRPVLIIQIRAARSCHSMLHSISTTLAICSFPRMTHDPLSIGLALTRLSCRPPIGEETCTGKPVLENIRKPRGVYRRM